MTKQKNKIGIASDHAGFDMKSTLQNDLQNISWIDYGAYNADSTDYPLYAQKVAHAIQKNEINFGILICGTGIGMSIAANRYRGVRAALCSSRDFAIMSRKHNNANVLILPGKIISVDLALEIVKIFLNTEFEGGRHLRRISLIEEIE
ncbi:MAG: ribose 5-phosphate isomerase B [Rickettsiales bacterium]|nr:ribose 5-phosphate isomerase B [Rickettsiales bacterium]|tara:strand:- start:19680 stop:20123 length:444 start_codon:yes stop_codon:yes gene_type:complete